MLILSLSRGHPQGAKIKDNVNSGIDGTECLRYNSPEWLQGPRLGNANDTLLVDASFARRMIMSSLSLSKARSLLSKTLCDSKSPFVSLKNIANDDDRMLRYWKTRLVYLAIHAHQHQPALLEAQLRSQPSCNAEGQLKHDIGPFDFECPDAKFLVVRLFSNGIGANMRLGAVPAFMAGLATNRVVVFVNNAPVGPVFLKNPWELVDCLRGDMQCFFQPSTPCALTHDELNNAPVLRKDEVRLIFRNGTLLKERQAERVLILHLSFRPQREPKNLRQALYNLALPMAQTLAHEADDQEHSIILRAVTDLLQPVPSPTMTYNYYGANSPLFHGLLFYAMRPNPRVSLSLQNIVKESLPDDYSPENSIGLPIRASDKCDVESECLELSQYVRSVSILWPEENVASIVVTTESHEVIRQLKMFAFDDNASSSTPFPARFVTNKRDVLQNTGFLHNQKQQRNYTQQDVMLSAISSLMLQMTTGQTVGNCCSNFHLLLSDFLSEGCGLVSDNQFVCLQDHPDPEFRICCQWDKSSECIL